MPQTHWYQELFTRRMLICVFTGFSSGLPLYLLLNLVPAWLKTEQIDLKAIGLVIAGAISLHLEIYLVTVDRPLSYSEFRPPPRLDVDLTIGIDCGDCGAGLFLTTNLTVDDCLSGFWRGFFQRQSGYCAGCVSP